MAHPARQAAGALDAGDVPLRAPAGRQPQTDPRVCGTGVHRQGGKHRIRRQDSRWQNRIARQEIRRDLRSAVQAGFARHFPDRLVHRHIKRGLIHLFMEFFRVVPGAQRRLRVGFENVLHVESAARALRPFQQRCREADSSTVPKVFDGDPLLVVPDRQERRGVVFVFPVVQHEGYDRHPEAHERGDGGPILF